ncbi:DUF4249 domain-containing protein [Flagellimonas algicola]|uniref:DUF4249 domain-containing protein n=1 Tax=Flagellimonas algicola TaxID=2583815 RepID=A0ABY2WNY6_9FLAO|nr:DUF4249 domain-containing protein [Allomuricauda algicola]TMU56703.1 DUF4249 domain-containing protein [Allomuricauda algicola]
MKSVLSHIKYFFAVSFSALILYGCIEPFDGEFVDFQSALVIEATITNELRNQQVILSRTYEFEADGPIAESNATVRLMANGNTIAFQDSGDGVYISEEAFAAQAGVEYQLDITTDDGRTYGSRMTQLTATTSLDEVKAERITNDFGEDGMGIFVDSYDSTGSSKNYRYEYIETYRVIAPTWSPISLIGDAAGGCNVIKVPNTTDEEICYATDFSNEIILTSTEDLEEDRVSNFMVRFISRDNYIISHRYSILVRQYVQSNAAYTFFETLNELSGSESLFSQTQPGFLEGNVFSKETEEETVIGFFDVVSVDEKRLFFNFNDFYPGEPLPPYVENCRPSAPPLVSQGGTCVLRPIIESGLGVYVADNSPPALGEGPFQIAPRICGDCRELGTTELPDFWIE